MTGHPPDPAPATPPVSTSSSPVDRHRTLIVVSLVAAVLAALAAGADGLRTGSLLLTLAGLELTLAALVCWWVLDAAEVRRKQSLLPKLDDETAPCDAGPADPAAADAAQRVFAEARSMHFIFLVVPIVVVLSLALFRLWGDFVGVSSPLSPAHATAAGVIAFALSCLWMVLAESFSSIPREELAESAALAQAFREARWTALVVGAGLIGSQAVAGLDTLVGRGLALWVIAAALEQTVRGLWVWFFPGDTTRPFMTPAGLLLREAVLVRGNPLASVFDTLESRFGLSFRSSWGIRFVRNTTVPVLALLGLIVWGFTALGVVEVHQFGVEERFGRVVPQPLEPGLHVTLPWPFGRIQRYPVKTVSTMRVGFEEDESAPRKLGQRAMLWTQAHAKEFSLVLGSGTEVVAVNAIVSYKIHEDAPRFLDYVYRTQDPVARLETCAYRCLREETQSATLSEVLTENRLDFARRIHARLRECAEEERLGIDVIDVGIVNLHPPVEAASDYLDVISAGLDATRVTEEARGESQVRLQTAAGEGLHLKAQAAIEASRRVGRAQGESPEFVAAAEAFENSPAATRSRLWFDAMEQILGGKRLFVLDPSLARGSGELLLDLRPPSSSSTSPPPITP